MRRLRLKFCVVEPVLYKLKGFSFTSLAYDEMHSLEGITKHLIGFCLERVKESNPQYRSVFSWMDKAMEAALRDGAPLLRKVPKGFTSMTMFAFAEWKSVVVMFPPVICMICPGTKVEKAVCSFMKWRRLARRRTHTTRTRKETHEVKIW
jgi:hypothetical protein